MSFIFGGSDSSTKTASQTNTSATNNSSSSQDASSTTTLPSYLQPATSNFYDQINALVNQAGTPGYAASLIPGVSASQQSAYDTAPNLQSMWSPFFGSAAALGYTGASQGVNTSAATTLDPATMTYAAQVAPAVGTSAASAQAAQIDPSRIQSYLNPYTQDVVDTTNQQLDKTDGEQQAALEAQGASSGAFGGSRFGLAQSNLLGTQGLNRATVDSGLYSQGFNTSLQYANDDADRQQQASITNAQLAQEANNNTAAAKNANILAQAGYDQTGLSQTAAAYNAANLAQGSLSQANNQFNATQGDNYLARQLTAAGLFGTLGNNYASNLFNGVNTQLSAGQDQRSVQGQQNASQLALESYLSSLLPGANNLLGHDATGTNTSTSTATGTSNTNGSSSTSGFNYGFNSGGGSSSGNSSSGSNPLDILKFFGFGG